MNRPDWRERIARLATRAATGNDVVALRGQGGRVGRAYSDGALGEHEYAARLSNVDARVAAAETVAGPEVRHVAAG